jgi:hemerythrin superfamily protein
MATKRKTESQDVVTLLQDDHQRVQKLFKQAEKLDAQEDSAELQEIVQTACMELTIHAEVEEELVYPAFRDVLEDTDMVVEAEIEHQSAKDLIAQLEEMDPSDERYKPTFTVLGEYINHHVNEEEKEIFPKVRKTDLDLDGLGQQVVARKAELQAELGEETPAAQDAQ